MRAGVFFGWQIVFVKFFGVEKFVRNDVVLKFGKNLEFHKQAHRGLQYLKEKNIDINFLIIIIQEKNNVTVRKKC